MTNERISYLLQQYLAQRISEAERHELSALLLENEDNEQFQADMEALMRNTAPDANYNEMEWEPVFAAITRREAPVRSMRWMSYAAAVLLIVVGAWYFWPSQQPPAQPTVAQTQPVILPAGDKAILKLPNGKSITLDSSVKQLAANLNNDNGQLNYTTNSTTVEYHTLSTPRGGKYQLILPDGTAIWLNAASSIRYPTAFTGAQREVEITGEAYFEVAKNAQQPFIVHAGNSDIRVLGTHFNVNAYTGEPATEITLLEGKVLVKANDSAVLNPGEQVSVSHTSHVSQPIPVQTDKAIAWKNGLFDFNGADLPTVMRQLERWYDIDVHYEGTAPTITFRGKMDRNVNLADMLDILTRMEVKYKQEGRTLTITP